MPISCTSWVYTILGACTKSVPREIVQENLSSERHDVYYRTVVVLINLRKFEVRKSWCVLSLLLHRHYLSFTTARPHLFFSSIQLPSWYGFPGLMCMLSMLSMCTFLAASSAAPLSFFSGGNSMTCANMQMHICTHARTRASTHARRHTHKFTQVISS